MPRLDEKLKMKLIIKTYILLKGKARPDELSEFLTNNFRFSSYVSPRVVSLILRDKNRNSVLHGLKRREFYSHEKQRNFSEYYF